MNKLRALLPCSVGIVLAGCSIHPLPNDVTRETTFQIVQRVRCEARNSVIAALARELRDRRSSEWLADSIDTRSLHISKFVSDYDAGLYRDSIQPASVDRILVYRRSAIGFDFRFNITEQNDNTFTANFVDLISLGAIDLNVSAGNKRERKNERSLRVISTFNDLITDQKLHEECFYPETSDADWLYPITGRIGLDEMFYTFLNIAEFAGIPDSDLTAATNFKDKLTFTTEFFGTADPKITINTGGSEFRLKDATGQTKADRIDVHEVTIALAIDKAKARKAGQPTPLRAAPSAEPGRRTGFAPSRRQPVSAREGATVLAPEEEVRRILDEEKLFLAPQREILQRLDELE